jgi:hypothetical protein
MHEEHQLSADLSAEHHSNTTNILYQYTTKANGYLVSASPVLFGV